MMFFPPFFSNSKHQHTGEEISKNSFDHTRDASLLSLSLSLSVYANARKTKMTSYLAHDPPRVGAAATTANCRFSAVFEATKPAYRAMADISGVGVTGRFKAFLCRICGTQRREKKVSWYWQLKGKKQQQRDDDDDALDEEFQRE